MKKQIIPTIAGLIILYALGWYVDSILHAEIVASARYILYTLAWVLIVALIGIGLFSVLIWREAYLRQVARRKKEERKANALVVDSQHGLYVREMDKKAVWRPLHLNAATYQNGRQGEVSLEERQAWRDWTYRNAPQRVIEQAQPVGLLPAPEYLPVELPTQYDLLDYLPAQPRLNNIFLGLRVKDGRLTQVSAPIWQLVHIANAGATDSGKSNMERVLAYQVSLAPNVQTIFVDLKRQTFKPFWDSSKNLYPIIKDTPDFITVLGELRGEIERRLSLFESYRTLETIHDYNRTVEQPLPYVVMFLDEVSNLMTDKTAHNQFLEIIRIARAAGVYIVAAGQTWSHRTLSPDTRSQFRTSFCFATSDAYASRMMINSSRATEIEVQGRAYASLPFGLTKDVIELQTPYLDLQTVVDTLPQGGSVREIPVSEVVDKDDLFRRLIAEGLTRTEASLEAYGKVYSGGHVTYCKQILGEL